MEILLIPIFGIALFGLCTSTLWMSASLHESPRSGMGRFLFSQFWLLGLLVLLPSSLGEFARHEVSPLPWRACWVAFERHGFIDAIFELVSVGLVDLWIFVVPARLYCQAVTGISNRERVLAYLFNFSVGLLLVTPANPIYRLLGVFHPESGDWP
jgi:hypothetical protein